MARVGSASLPRVGSRSGAPLGIEEVDEEEVFDGGDPDEDEARALSNEAFEVLFRSR